MGATHGKLSQSKLQGSIIIREPNASPRCRRIRGGGARVTLMLYEFQIQWNIGSRSIGVSVLQAPALITNRCRSGSRAWVRVDPALLPR
jgi:hypothetical protein